MSKILIVGLGLSGVSAYNYFRKNPENKIFVTDSKKPTNENFLSVISSDSSAYYFGEEFDLSLLGTFDFIIKSPGIPYSNRILSKALELNMPIYTDVEFSTIGKSKVIGITGSNGKTTTTTLVGEMFDNSTFDSAVCGNIGFPILDFFGNGQEKEVLVAELSSFQLKGTEKFHPSIAAFLNFNPTHLDFHGDETDYFQSKLKIFQNLNENDYAVMNFDDPHINQPSVVSGINAPIFFFSRTHELSNGSFIREGNIFFASNNQEELICSVASIPLMGSHNVENVLAAITIAKLQGIDTNIIAETIKNFRSVEHRLEEVQSPLHFRIFNDSKSTNPTSSLSACKSFDNHIRLILGGMNRGADFSVLKDQLPKVSKVYTFGESKEILKEQLSNLGYYNVEMFESLEDLVKKSFKESSQDDTLLFSPGCASWDMYSSYTERGRIFKEEIQKAVVASTGSLY